MTRTAGELAQYLGARLEGDASMHLAGVSSPERAAASELIYLDSPRHLDRVSKSAARCVVAPLGSQIAGKTILAVDHPKLAFAKAAQWLAPARKPKAAVHSTALVAPEAKLAPDVFLGPYVVVEGGSQIASGAVIEAFCFIGRDCRIGENCWLHPRVTLYPGCHLGTRVEIHSGAVLGSDGFGYVFGEGKHWKFPQAGGLEIADDVEIGANTALDRGSLDTTRISRGVKIDNLVQIAHNVQIGEHSVVAAQTGISGSSTLGAGVLVGGQVGIADHCKLEDGAIAGAQAGIPTGKIIRRGQTVWGTPARPLDRFKEQYARFARLGDLLGGLDERLRALEGGPSSRLAKDRD
jgi:UDP-3-O-[3-hydroxymyristoyl] glucosamine N-acyltransferase